MEIYSHVEENYSKRKISDFLHWTQIAFISEFFFCSHLSCEWHRDSYDKMNVTSFKHFIGTHRLVENAPSGLLWLFMFQKTARRTKYKHRILAY